MAHNLVVSPGLFDQLQVNWIDGSRPATCTIMTWNSRVWISCNEYVVIECLMEMEEKEEEAKRVERVLPFE